MSSYWIEGQRRLKGNIRIGGAKNAVLPILAATLLVRDTITLLDCPKLLDVDNMLSILKLLGCDVHRHGHVAAIDASAADCWEMPQEMAKKLRSSFFMLGPVLGRFKKARFTYPGGCEIGSRPIDLHLKGLRQLGVAIEENHGYILCDGKDMRGAQVHLDYPSVGATENMMMAAACAKGETVITNAAREPEIEDLQKFLNACGARIQGAGTSTICIQGVESIRALHGIEHRVLPDRIVAGTYMVAAAITAGTLELSNICPEHVDSMVHKLREAGCDIEVAKDSLCICGPDRPLEMPMIETLPYPGFPTDMQAQFFALATIAQGTSVVVENVFDSRFKHATELLKMGANITLRDRMAVIRGVDTLQGGQVQAKDLRGGAALILAGLRAQGETQVISAHHIDRGYEDIALALGSVGARIKRVEES